MICSISAIGTVPLTEDSMRRSLSTTNIWQHQDPMHEQEQSSMLTFINTWEYTASSNGWLSRIIPGDVQLDLLNHTDKNWKEPWPIQFTSNIGKGLQDIHRCRKHTDNLHRKHHQRHEWISLIWHTKHQQATLPDHHKTNNLQWGRNRCQRIHQNSHRRHRRNRQGQRHHHPTTRNAEGAGQDTWYIYIYRKISTWCQGIQRNISLSRIHHQRSERANRSAQAKTHHR